MCVSNMHVNIIHSKAVYTSAAYFSIDAFLKKYIFYIKPLYFLCAVKSTRYFIVYGNVSFYFNLQICILVLGFLAGDANWPFSKLSTWVKKVDFILLLSCQALEEFLCAESCGFYSHQGILRRMHFNLFLQFSLCCKGRFGLVFKKKKQC